MAEASTPHAGSSGAWLKPVPKGVAATIQKFPPTTLSGLVVPESLVEGLDAAQTIEALGLTHRFWAPPHMEPVTPYLDDGKPVAALYFIRFEMDDAMRRALVLPVRHEMAPVLQGRVPIQVIEPLRHADGRVVAEAGYTGSGGFKGDLVGNEMFLRGHHPIPRGSTLIRRL